MMLVKSLVYLAEELYIILFYSNFVQVTINLETILSSHLLNNKNTTIAARFIFEFQWKFILVILAIRSNFVVDIKIALKDEIYEKLLYYYRLITMDVFYKCFM